MNLHIGFLICIIFTTFFLIYCVQFVRFISVFEGKGITVMMQKSQRLKKKNPSCIKYGTLSVTGLKLQGCQDYQICFRSDGLMGLKGIYSFSLIMLATVPRRAKMHCTIRQSKLQILNPDRHRSHAERQKGKGKEIQHDSGKRKKKKNWTRKK